MTISLTPEEKAEVKREDFLIRELPGASGVPSGTFHNPVTGKEIYKQPMDSYHLMRRLRQGWQLGPASPELKEKWLVREQELREEDDRMVAEHVASDEHQESEKTRFNEAVAEATKVAVAAVLEKLGKDPTAGAEKAAPAPAPGEMIAVLQLPEGLGTASESGTKLNVPQVLQLPSEVAG